MEGGMMEKKVSSFSRRGVLIFIVLIVLGALLLSVGKQKWEVKQRIDEASEFFEEMDKEEKERAELWEKYQNKEACAKAGGEWGIHWNIKGEEECRMRTNDVGKICYSQRECQGNCFAEVTGEEMASIQRGKEVRKNGRCSEWSLNYGTFLIVTNGIVGVVNYD